MRAAVYTRVSTEEQALHGTSLEDQWRRGEAHARGQGADSVERYEDAGASGASLQRPALARLRSAVAAGALDLVVVLDPDRLARRLVDQLLVTDEIIRHANLAFVQFDWQDSADGRLFYALRGAVAEFERERIRQRTDRGRHSAAAAGRIAAAPHQAFGYAYDRRDHRLRVVPSEAVIVREIFALCGRREHGCTSIAARLNRLALPARHGGRWHPESVRRILRNPLYMGRLRQLGTHVDAPAVLDEGLWRLAQDVLDRHRGRRPGRARRPYLLRGFLRCGRCGLGLVARAPGRGRRDRRYVCAGRRRRTCAAPSLPAAALERAVWHAVRRAVRLALATDGRTPTAGAHARAPSVAAERRRLLRLARVGAIAAPEAALELVRLDRVRRLARTGAQASGPKNPPLPPTGRRARFAARRELLALLETSVVTLGPGRVRLSLRLPPLTAPRRLRRRPATPSS